MLKIEYGGKVYHMGCFTCEACGGSLKNRKVESLGGALYHTGCFEEIQAVVSQKS